MSKLFFVKVSYISKENPRFRSHENFDDIKISSSQGISYQVLDQLGYRFKDSVEDFTVDFIIPMSQFD